MRKLLNYTTRMGLSGFSNMLLAALASSVAVTSIILLSLYVVSYAKESDAMKALQCASGLVSRPDCPDQQAAMDALQQELDALAAQKEQMEAKLGTLKRISDTVDSVTLFKMVDIDGTGMKLIVGSTYSDLLNPTTKPAYHCYISLRGNSSHGNNTGIERNLYIRSAVGDVDITKDMLRDADITEFTVHFARAHCKPYLIGGAV